jgi:hypothetical protein
MELQVCQFQIVSTEGVTPNCAQTVPIIIFGVATIAIIDIQCLLPPLVFQ